MGLLVIGVSSFSLEEFCKKIEDGKDFSAEEDLTNEKQLFPANILTAPHALLVLTRCFKDYSEFFQGKSRISTLQKNQSAASFIY